MSERTTIWRLAWPVMVGMSSHMLFHLVDLYWIGMLGKEALAAVAVAGSLMMFLWTGTSVARTGGVAIMSQAFGRKDDEAVGLGAVDTLVVAGVIGVIVFGLAWLSRAPVIAFFELGDSVRDFAVSYFSIVLLGIPLMYLVEGSVAHVLALGRTKVTMVMGLFCNGVNLVLDPLLIFGIGPFPGMGLAGAAWATLASTFLFLACVTVWQVLYGGLKLRYFRLRIPGLRRVTEIGLPAAVRDVSRPLVVIIMYRFLSPFGVAVVGAYGLVSRIVGLNIVYIIGLSVALTTMVGQRIGEQRHETIDDVIRQGLALGLIIHAAAAVIMMVFSVEILALFDKTGAVVRAGAPCLRIFAIMGFFILASRSLGSAFSGAGDTRPIMKAALMSHWLVQLPLAWGAVSYIKNPLWVWLAILTARAVEAGVLYVYFNGRDWPETASV